MDWISTCGWGEDLELILANQAKEHSKRGTNTSGSTLAKVKYAWWQIRWKRPEHKGWAQVMMREKKKNGWTQIRALAVSNINIDTVSKPVYYQV